MTKKTRPWGATGVIDLPHYKMDADNRTAIHEILQNFTKDGTEYEAFFAALNQAIAIHKGHVAMGKASSPRVVRQKLERVKKLAQELSEALLDLDANSKQLLDQGPVGYLATLDASSTILGEVARARARADEYPSGRLPDHPAMDLCERVAQALEEHLGIKATTTRNGPFEGTMYVVLQAATGREPEACHDLVARALRRRRAERSK